MKKQIDLQLLAIIGGGVLFNYLFWMERLALNLLLYSIFIMLALWLDPKMTINKKTALLGGAHLLAAVLVIFNNANLNVLTWYISLAIFIGFAYLPSLRSVFFAIGAAILQAITVPVNLSKKLMKVKLVGFSLKPFYRSIKYIVIPIVLMVLFGMLYRFANETFAKYLDLIFTNLGTFIANIFDFFFADISLLRVFHLILGILVTAALLIYYHNESLEKLELSFVERLTRLRKPKPITNGLIVMRPKAQQKRKLGLKIESIVGIISFAALNLLILSLNLIDVITLWLRTRVAANFSYSAELHEGTNALIWSIICAMAVIVYFFRGNLNFYSKNKAIKLLAYIWIIQNVFLVASVFLRDYNYIDIQGLTYKRIGVLIFLLLCLIGLITVYLKVKQQKTFFYLLKANGQVWYIFLLLFGFVNWDVLIMGYNINNKHTISTSVEHALRMSDKTIPLLDQHFETLKTYIVVPKSITTESQKLAYTRQQTFELREMINFRISKFKTRWAETSWLSWNYRDWQTERYLSKREANGVRR